MRDGPVRAFVKTSLARSYVRAAQTRRDRLAARGQQHWVLAGECGGCASCCEEPSVAVGALMFYVPLLSAPYLWWQRVVNGFVLKARDRESYAFRFTCTHFDVATRRCDSYESRPGMCHDYPRMQLEVFEPELFDRCGYRVVAKNGDAMIAALEAKGVHGDQLVQITKKLRLK
jgi:Fe-S-cluster containining protein